MEYSHRLYRLGFNSYVQHDGASPLPQEVQEYCLRSQGEPPPFMPLPQGPVVFRLDVKVPWNGRGLLPDGILWYICENGTLPPYIYDKTEA